MLKPRVQRFYALGLALAMAAAGCARNSRQYPAQTAPALAPAAPAGATNALAGAESKTGVEAEYQALLDADDEAQADVDKWIRDNQEFAAKGAGVPQTELKERIRQRLEPVRKGYEDFIKRHPAHATSRVAYAGFLGDLGEEAAAKEQLELALALDPKNAAAYNNLANIYGHEGPVKKAFECFTKAIELKPLESVYYHNFGTTVYVFRKDAMEHFGINEQQAIEKALSLYSNAFRADPDNFPVASDVAQTYYALKPLPTDAALNAWTNALRVAHDDVEREGVQIHLARIKMVAGRFAEAHAHLASVTNAVYNELKGNLIRNLEQREHPTGANAPPPMSVSTTNALPAAPEKR